MKAMFLTFTTILFIMVVPLSISAQDTQTEKKVNPAADWSILSMIPNETEIVIHLNAKKLNATGIVEKMLRKKGKWDQVVAIGAVMEQLTGTNLLTGIDDVFLFGRIDEKEKGGIVIKGNLAPERLITLAKVNKRYQEFQQDGHTIYGWYDKKDERMKYGAFSSVNTLVIWNSESALHKSLEAYRQPDKRADYKKVPQIIPTGFDDAILWGLMVPQENHHFDHLQTEAVSMMIGSNGDQFDIHFSMAMKSEEAAKQAVKVIEGLQSLAMLQKFEKNLADIAGGAQTGVQSQKVTLGLSLPMPIVLDLIK